MPDWAKTLTVLTGAVLALVGLALLFQGNFYILVLVIFPLLMGAVVLLAMTIIMARMRSLEAGVLGQFISNRGIRIGAGVVIIAALAIGLFFLASGPTALPARTPTPAWTFQPSTTLTPSPLDFQPAAPKPASTALQTMLCIVVWVIPLVIAFTRPGAWDGKILREVFLGFLGWFLVNTLLWLWVDFSLAHAPPSSGAAIWQLERAVPPLVNIVAVPILFFIRRWMTLGIFSAIIVNAIGTFLVTPITAYYGDKAFVRITAAIPFFLPPFFPRL